MNNIYPSGTEADQSMVVDAGRLCTGGGETMLDSTPRLITWSSFRVRKHKLYKLITVNVVLLFNFRKVT